MTKTEQIRLTLAGVSSAMFAALGWKGLLVLAWVALMGLDYLTGTLAAMKNGQWNSQRAREGVWHKSGEMVVTAVSAITDGIMVVLCGNIPLLNMAWPGVLLPLILAWYILTELGSILENAIALGANPPAWLGKLLAVSLKTVDDAASKTAG